MIIVHIAEKPSVAKSLAHIMSEGSYGDGPTFSTPVHTFDAPFRSSKIAHHRVSAVTGHIFSLDFTDEHNAFGVDPLTLYHAPVRLKREAKSMPDHLRSLCEDASHLVLWLDADREGEAICFEILDCISKTCKPQVHRAIFTAVTPQEVQHALEHLGKPDRNAADAVAARQELDLKIGVSFTRFMTHKFRELGYFRTRTISYGPCQSPALGFCVGREDMIRRFKPQPYWCLEMELAGAARYRPAWGGGRLMKEAEGIRRLSAVSSIQHAVVTRIQTRATSHSPPTPMNTVAMLKMASTLLGISPHHALGVAERLYNRGFLSYPRTESTAFPPSMDLQLIVDGIAADRTAPKTVQKYAHDLGTIRRPTGGVAAGDHAPIHPTGVEGLGIAGEEAVLLGMIQRHFLACMSPCAEGESTTIALTLGAEEFSLTSSRLTVPSFRALYERSAVVLLPSVKVGDKMEVSSITLPKAMTVPPPLLSEADLLGEMEKHSIGTDASMSGHIETIQKRDYVRLVDRKLAPTDLGRCLIHGLDLIDSELVSSTLRAAMEEAVTQVAEGKVTKHELLSQGLAYFRYKYRFFVQNLDKMGQLFDAKFAPASGVKGKGIGRCRCGRVPRLLQRPRRLFCEHCDTSYIMPDSGKIVALSGTLCPLDGHPLFLNSCGGAEQQQVFCPICYSVAKSKLRGKEVTCDLCTEDCTHSMTTNRIAPCPECGGANRPAAGGGDLRVSGRGGGKKRQRGVRMDMECMAALAEALDLEEVQAPTDETEQGGRGADRDRGRGERGRGRGGRPGRQGDSDYHKQANRDRGDERRGRQGRGRGQGGRNPRGRGRQEDKESGDRRPRDAPHEGGAPKGGRQDGHRGQGPRKEGGRGRKGRNGKGPQGGKGKGRGGGGFTGPKGVKGKGPRQPRRTADLFPPVPEDLPEVDSGAKAMDVEDSIPPAVALHGGVLVLGTKGSPPRICCNRCSLMLLFPQGRVTITGDECGQCGARCVRHETKDGTRVSGCPLCEGNPLSALVERKMSKTRYKFANYFIQQKRMMKRRGGKKRR